MSQQDLRGPCRHACRHYDCLMDRGEPLPPGVVAYQGGVRYHDQATRARAREEAIRVVDGQLGHTMEFSGDPDGHARHYDEEEARILARIARQEENARSGSERE